MAAVLEFEKPIMEIQEKIEEFEILEIEEMNDGKEKSMVFCFFILLFGFLVFFPFFLLF